MKNLFFGCWYSDRGIIAADAAIFVVGVCYLLTRLQKNKGLTVFRRIDGFSSDLKMNQAQERRNTTNNLNKNHNI